MQKYNRKAVKKFQKYKKGTLENLKIKFYYRPDWWKYRYVRWVSVGKRKNVSRKKRYSIIWTYKKLNTKDTALFSYRTLKQKTQKADALATIKKNFFSITGLKKLRTLEHIVTNFYCVLDLPQARYIIKKGWVLINGYANKNPKIKLKLSDVVTLSPLVWSRLSVWFFRFHKKKTRLSFKKVVKRSYKQKKRKFNKKKLTYYKNFKTFILFRKINSLSPVK